MIRFEQYKNFQETSYSEQLFLENIIKSIGEPGNYYTNLQLIYNNDAHFVNGKFGLGLDFIQSFPELIKSTTVITVQGGIHCNYHMSNILVGSRNNGLFVRDTYIRIKIGTEGPFHILVAPPIINQENYMVYSDVYNIDSNTIIYPIVEV